MTTFDWPRDLAWRPMAGRFWLDQIGHVSTSPFTGSSKGVSINQIWRAELTWNNHALADGVDIQGFIEGLEGFTNTVRVFDFWRTEPPLLKSAQFAFTDGTQFSDGTGFTDGYSLSVLNAAAKGGAYVSVAGLPVSANCFKRGDLVGLGGYVYQLRAAVASNAAGQAMLWLQPGLRLGLAAGDVCTIYYPTMPMRLMETPAGVHRNFNWTEGFTLKFAEDVP